MNQAQSLWKLLGNEDNPTESGTRDPNWDRYVVCPGEENDIRITYVRNDQLIENDKPCDVAKDLRNCYAYCYPWVDKYLAFEGTTLLIASTGAHYQTHHQFQYALREFVKTVDSLNRNYDHLIFRTATPGHRGCDDFPTTPFKNFTEYALTISDEYSWDKFVGYNDYAVKFFDAREREDSRGLFWSVKQSDGVMTEPKRMKMEILDVYPMTVLRRDGHVSGEICDNCHSTIKDCLHYFLPGPPDWWNHMMYSHLSDLVRTF